MEQELVTGVAAGFPERVRLVGRLVEVVPLDAEAHGGTLYEGSHGPEAEAEALWRYMPDGPFPDAQAFKASLKEKAAAEDRVFFAIVERRLCQAVGYASYMNIACANRSIEVGSILYTPRLRGTPGGTEAMYLMARYAFEELGYRRYEWKCNALNEPSRQAALRYGFRFEGVFRQHMIVKGRNRDTAWFSMLDKEWPERRVALEAWLAPENFNADGSQKTALRRVEE